MQRYKKIDNEQWLFDIFCLTLQPINRKTMKRTIVALVLLTIIGTITASAAQETDEEVDLHALYQQIDDAIDHAPQYVAKRLSQIAEAQQLLIHESSLEKQLSLAGQIFELFKPYRNDSALYYADLCVALADSLHRKDIAGLYLSEKAHQYSNAGLYAESLDLLRKIDKETLDREGLTKYYSAWMHVCGEMGSYAQQQEERLSYYGLQDSYRDSVLAVAEEGSVEYLHLKMDILNARQQYQEALNVNDNWLDKATDDTHESAYAAFYRSIVYEKLDNGQSLRYWLGRSALDDIKSAVNDQASLFMLAERLCEDGDYERALRYVRFCEQCNISFSPQLRNYQMRYVANVMEAVCQNAQTRYYRLLLIAGLGAILLLGAIIWLLFRRVR